MSKRSWLSIATLFAAGLLAGAAFAQNVTLTGDLQASNGLPAKNYTINFQPSQMFYVAGTSLVVNTATSCATSTSGAVVGIRTPLAPPLVIAGGSGTMPAGTYFVRIAWYDAAGNETQGGPEAQAQLTAAGDLVVTTPTTGVPANAAGMRVYIGTAAGMEYLQGSTVGQAPFIKSAPLVIAATPHQTNGTLCQQVANDAGWPTGTSYTVSLTDPSGNTLPGYPMQWQLLGPGTTINLSNGLPYASGIVTYPTPIISTPQNGNPQSITGALTAASLNAQSVNGIQNADQQTGVDIGAKINAAFAACNGNGCHVDTQPGQAYTFLTTINLPAAYAELDCHGSSLIWTGVGDAITVAALNGNNNSGAFKNCMLLNQNGNTAAVNGIHQFSRIAFSYEGSSVYGFANPTSSGLLLDNVSTPWGGYNERTNWRNDEFWNNTKGIRLLGSDGGTNSLAYSTASGLELNVMDGQIGISMEGYTDVYGGFWDIKGNLSCYGSPCSLVSVTGGALWRGAFVSLNAEGGGTCYGINVDGAPSGVSVVGTRIYGNLSDKNGATSDALQFVTFNGGTMLLQAPPYQHGVEQARNSKLIYDGTNLRFYAPRAFGAEGNGSFQVFGRVTSTADPEADVPAVAGVNAPFTIISADPLSGSVGIGPGYDSVLPKFNLEVHGTFALVNPAIGYDGTIWSRSIDGNGNGIEQFTGAALPGQSTFKWLEQMRDYTNYANDQGLSRTAHDGRMHYAYPEYTPASSTDLGRLCEVGELTHDDNYVYACVSSRTWKRTAALSTF